MVFNAEACKGIYRACLIVFRGSVPDVVIQVQSVRPIIAASVVDPTALLRKEALEVYVASKQCNLH